MTDGASPAEASPITQQIASNVTKVQEVGGLTGRILLALLVVGSRAGSVWSGCFSFQDFL